MFVNIVAEKIKTSIQTAVKNAKLGQLTELNNDILDQVAVERTKNPDFGDFSCNVSFLARFSKLPPVKIAETIVDCFSEDDKTNLNINFINGFINFKISEILLNEVISDILSKRNSYGKTCTGDNLKVLLEYVSANPTGPLHIGHGRWAALGSSIERILKSTGHDVTTEFYINDAGVQIRNLGYSLFLRILQEKDPKIYFPLDKVSDPRAGSFYPGDYVSELAKQFIKQYPDKPQIFLESSSIDNNLYVPTDEVINELANFAKPIILKQQKELLSKFQTKFNNWYSETELHENGKVAGIIGYLADKGVLYDKDGATWFASSKYYDDQDRVIKKSDGTLTYLTADIAYHKDKFDRGFEHLINIWGADHHGYVPRMKSAVDAIGKSAKNLEVIIGQMVNLIIDGEQVRMGKRKKMLTLEELIEEVGVDATRFWMVSRSTDTTLDFDIELAKSSSDDNPVFYVQYAHARCCSIFRTATNERLDQENKCTLPPLYTKDELINYVKDIASNPFNFNVVWKESSEKQVNVTKNLILCLETYKNILSKASRDRSPHYIAKYLQDLASALHSFYSECRVLNLNSSPEFSKELQNARLALIDSVRQLLYNGLELLGVSAPESM